MISAEIELAKPSDHRVIGTSISNTSQPTIETITSCRARICYIRLMNAAFELTCNNTYFFNEPISNINQDPENEWCEIYSR